MYDIDAYIDGWRRARVEDALDVVEHGAKARALLPLLVRVLVDGWRPRRIFLIGSLASGRFRTTSDIDLVVEGLPAAALFDACAAVDRAAGAIHVDIAPLESARPFVRDLIARGEHEVLYDASTV